MSKLARILREHRQQIEEKLDSCSLLLTCLVKFQLIDQKTFMKIKHVKEPTQRNSLLVDSLLAQCSKVFTGTDVSNSANDGTSKSTDDSQQFQQFLDALRKTEQYTLLADITDFREEFRDAMAKQDVLETGVTDSRQFVKQEAEKAGMEMEVTFVKEKQGSTSSSVSTPATKKPTITRGRTKSNTSVKRTQSIPPSRSGSETQFLIKISRGKNLNSKDKNSDVNVDDKALARFQPVSDLSSVSATSDLEDTTPLKEPRLLSGAKCQPKRRRKQTFLTAPDSGGSSTGDINASDAENMRRYSKRNISAHTLQRAESLSTIDKDRMIIAVQKAQTTSESALRQLNRCETIIRELKQDRNDAVRRNELLAARIDNLNDHMTRMSQAHLLQSNPKRSTASQVSPIPEETGDNMDRSNKLPSVSKNTSLVARNPHSSATNKNPNNEGSPRENNQCVEILDDILHDIRQRQTVLSKDSDLPPKENNITLARRGRKEKEELSVVPSNSSELQHKIEELTKELGLYMHQEKQITHKYNLSRLQTTSALTYRTGDTVSKQIHLVEKEIVKHRGGRWQDVNVLVENTKKERDTCFTMMCDIETEITQRKRKLRSNFPELNNNSPLEIVRRYPRRQPLKTNLSKKMIKLQNEIKQYIHMEKSIVDRYRNEMDKNIKENVEVIKKKDREMRTLEHKLATAERERDMAKAKVRKQALEHAHLRASVHTPIPEEITQPQWGQPVVLAPTVIPTQRSIAGSNKPISSNSSSAAGNKHSIVATHVSSNVQETDLNPPSPVPSTPINRSTTPVETPYFGNPRVLSVRGGPMMSPRAKELLTLKAYMNNRKVNLDSEPVSSV